MGYSAGYFSENDSFLKLAITRKIEVGISSNFLHSIRTSICIRNVIKIVGDFGAIFRKKTIGYSTEYFSENQHNFGTIITAFLAVTIMNTCPPLPID